MFAITILTLYFGYHYYLKFNINYQNKIINIIQDKINKDEVGTIFDNYIEIIKIRRFFEDFKNKQKLINIYNDEKLISCIHNVLINYDKYIYIEKNKYENYYKKNVEFQDINIENRYIPLKIKDLYEEEQSIFIDITLFDIKNNKGYYKIFDHINNKEIYTNFAKLNVYKWIIEIGVYDIFL